MSACVRARFASGSPASAAGRTAAKKDRQILGLQRNGKALRQLQPELHGQDAADIGARIVITREHLLIADEGHIQPRGLDAAGRQQAGKAMGAVQNLFTSRNCVLW